MILSVKSGSCNSLSGRGEGLETFSKNLTESFGPRSVEYLPMYYNVNDYINVFQGQGYPSQASWSIKSTMLNSTF